MVNLGRTPEFKAVITCWSHFEGSLISALEIEERIMKTLRVSAPKSQLRPVWVQLGLSVYPHFPLKIRLPCNRFLYILPHMMEQPEPISSSPRNFTFFRSVFLCRRLEVFPNSLYPFCICPFSQTAIRLVGSISSALLSSIFLGRVKRRILAWRI